jgi:hypothetical protein
MFKEIDPTAKYYFAVDRATGRMSGYLNSQGGRAVVLDEGSSGSSFKAIYFSPGQARYLIIRTYVDVDGPWGFILTDDTNVVTGTSTLIR